MTVWDKYELIEFFGVLPEEDEDKTSLSFNVEKDGLRLHVSFYHYFFHVYIGLFREGIAEPVFHTRIENSEGMKYMSYANGWEGLEIAAPHRHISHEEDWIFPMGVRIRINPHISIEMFQPSAG